MKSSAVILALAASALAKPVKELAERQTVGSCSSVSAYISSFIGMSSASAFCSSFESILTTTLTVSATSTNYLTATNTITSTTTFTPVVTTSVTATCTTSPTKIYYKREANPWWFAPPPPPPPPKTSAIVATATACSQCPGNLNACAFQGTCNFPNKINTPGNCGSVETCRSACFGNSACLSFSFDIHNNCQHYGQSVHNMGLWKNPGSPVNFWEKNCFACTTTTTTLASSTTTPSGTTTYPVASSMLTAGCSCLGLNPNPVATSTVIVTAMNTAASSTITSVASYTATSTSTYTTIVTTISFQSNGTETVSDGDVYAIYPLADFYGANLGSGYCSPPNGAVTTVDGVTYPCMDFYDCMDICSKYNDANPLAAEQCLGVTFSEGTPNCYPKYAVPGQGQATCQVSEDPYLNDSAVLIQRHGSNGTATAR